MSASEKTTYKGALAAAMDSGAYIKFVEIHTEMKSELEAHKQCMFIYWHRLFLVLFENMLRGQGPRYACVTIPYYNWMAASNKALAGECNSLGECSPILKELGGFTGNSPKAVTINGVEISGNCVAVAPLNHFCQSSSSRGAACAGCLPRGNWGSAKVPASVSYASVIGQVFNGTNIDKVSRTVERGCHADIHATLGSTMTKFQSPADPIFWSHHAMLDALITIFHKCRVGTRRMTFAQKAADPVAWSSCRRRVGGKLASGPPFKPTDIVTMRTGQKGSNPIDARKDPKIGRYLSGVPNRFADLLDASDLGGNSYTYEISGLLAKMYSDCGGIPKKHNPTSAPKKVSPPHTAPIPPTRTPAKAPRPRAKAPARAPGPPARAPQPPARAPTTFRRPSTTSLTPSTRASRPLTPRPVTPTPASFRDWSQETRFQSFFDWLFRRGLPQQSTGSRRLAGCRAATSSKKENNEDMTGPSPISTAHDDLVITKHMTRSEKRVINWYNETMTSNGGKSADNIADMERQVCMFQEQCLGGIVEYTEEFKALWGVQEPRCRTIVNAINSGEQQILDSSWKEKMEAHFGCPHPKNETSGSGPDT
ncbi:unnamed protein product [Phytophthora fragariaefolia]|uniref:Unnamed protein product n=1 Tax=Phytophthora fragariaefolia TaxID=1490495 RepID=A0A9W6X9Y3_9STRA|nr:unnamed protein product [Phytophthora fragariaefolia]